MFLRWEVKEYLINTQCDGQYIEHAVFSGDSHGNFPLHILISHKAFMVISRWHLDNVKKMNG